MSELKRNPYTGMTMARSDNGNGEIIPVEDLINKEHPEWKQYTPIDTLENANSELYSLYNELSEVIDSGEKSETIKLEDFINKDKNENLEDNFDSLKLNDDFSSLTNVLY